MTTIVSIWNRILATGVHYAQDTNQKTRIMHANRMALYSLIVGVFFAFIYAILGYYILVLVMSVFVTLLILSFTLCQQGRFNTSRILYVFVANLSVFTYANFLGEGGGSQFLFFCLVPAVYTFFSAKEKELLIICVCFSPLLWTLLELKDYNWFELNMDISLESLVLIKFLYISGSFLMMFFFLYQFMMQSYVNEDLLNSSIRTLKTKEKELIEKNEEFSKTTNELMSIQQLLSANQVNLEQEKQKAERALKVKSDFLSSMSHEIRTPMNVIVGLTDLLLETEEDEETVENLSLIKNSSDNLLVIINDILDFSRMESGKLIIENIEFDLYKKIKEVTRSVGIRTKDNNNKLNFSIAPDVPKYITSDPVRITQVLINLLSNANKFTQNGNIDLFVSISKKISTTRSLFRFEIKDTGIGISKNAQEKIFESFTQASSSTTRQYGGTGLGLPISKRIVELMDGDIWVKSEQNQGSSFFFEIPLKHEQIEENSWVNLNCLVFEDFEMNQMIIRKTLGTLNVTVDFANSFKEFEEKLSHNIYSFYLVDFNKEGFYLENLEELAFQTKYEHLKNVDFLVFDNTEKKNSKIIRLRYVSRPINKNEIEAYIGALGLTSKN